MHYSADRDINRVSLSREASSSMEENILYHGLLSNAEKHYIERRVGHLYLGC